MTSRAGAGKIGPSRMYERGNINDLIDLVYTVLFDYLSGTKQDK